MKDVSINDGRTVLFVSHNMAAIQKLCTAGALLQKGTLKAFDSIENVISLYLQGIEKVKSSYSFQPQPALDAYVERLEVRDENDNLLPEIAIGKKWVVKIFYTIVNPLKNFVTAIGITNDLGISIKTSWQTPFAAEAGNYVAEFKEQDTIFAAGRYHLVIGLSDGRRVIQYLDNSDIGFDIIELIDEIDERVQGYNTKTGIILNQMQTTTRKI